MRRAGEDQGHEAAGAVLRQGKIAHLGKSQEAPGVSLALEGVRSGKKVSATQENHYGIGAIDVNPADPGYGKAISAWNNTTSTGRGAGWKGSLATSAGLWMGGDASTVNGDTTIRRLAFFPIS